MPLRGLPTPACRHSAFGELAATPQRPRVTAGGPSSCGYRRPGKGIPSRSPLSAKGPLGTLRGLPLQPGAGRAWREHPHCLPASFSASDSDASSSPSSSELELLDSLLPSSASWDLGVSSSYSSFSLLNTGGSLNVVQTRLTMYVQTAGVRERGRHLRVAAVTEVCSVFLCICVPRTPGLLPTTVQHLALERDFRALACSIQEKRALDLVGYGAGKYKRSLDGCSLNEAGWPWGGVPEPTALPVTEAAGTQGPYARGKVVLQSEFTPKCHTRSLTSAPKHSRTFKDRWAKISFVDA